MHRILSEILPKPKQFQMESGIVAAVKRPDLAGKVGAIFALSVDIEQVKASLLIFLLKGEPRAGMDLFLSLRSAQLPALKAVLKSKRPHLAKLFARVLKLCDKFDEHRNKFAHWVWSTCDQLPEHLCFIDPGVVAGLNVAIIENIPTIAKRSAALSDAGLVALSESLGGHREATRQSTHAYDDNALFAVVEKGRLALQAMLEFLTVATAPTKDEEQKRLLQLEALLPPIPPPNSIEGQSDEQ